MHSEHNNLDELVQDYVSRHSHTFNDLGLFIINYRRTRPIPTFHYNYDTGAIIDIIVNCFYSTHSCICHKITQNLIILTM